ncbi:WAP-type 'four-disulfide core' domain [Trinorchestia longiramus]|nr:WAP-type 'four-disulfide core' domain [Trinorchestia longiramus]
MNPKVAFAVVLCCVVVAVVSASDGCSYWCKTNTGQRYCCEEGPSPGKPFTKPGTCPRSRDVCPAYAAQGGHSPNVCSNDGACPGNQKCCFDTCLRHHTCKPPRY